MRTHPSLRPHHLLGAALLLIGAATAGAQSSVDPRWRAFLGCWSALNAEGVAAAGAPLTCVVPSDGATGVERLTVAGGRVTARERLDATGERRPRTVDGCEGWEQAQWSADGRRLHARSAATCATGVTRASSAILAFAPDGDWIEVRSASVGTGAGVRVTRYRPAAEVAPLPQDVSAALAGVRPDEDARVALGAPVSTAEVADAVRLSDAAVVEGWLAARGQGFKLDARTLSSLADRGVPARVIDVMVALSYPKVFALNPATGDQQRRAAAPGERQVSQRSGPVAWLYDPIGYSAFGWNPYRYGAYGAYGYSSFYDPYYRAGYFGSGYYPGGSPVVIVVRDDQPSGDRPRAVNGRGYTRGSPGTGSPGATPRASVGSGGYGGGSSSTGSSSSGSSSSGSSGGGGRTAKPRP